MSNIKYQQLKDNWIFSCLVMVQHSKMPCILKLILMVGQYTLQKIAESATENSATDAHKSVGVQHLLQNTDGSSMYYKLALRFVQPSSEML